MGGWLANLLGLSTTKMNDVLLMLPATVHVYNNYEISLYCMCMYQNIRTYENTTCVLQQ